LDFTALRVSQTTRDQVLAAVTKTQPPANGIVFGMVVDSTGAPVAGATVSYAPHPPAGTDLQYLSADRTTIQAGGTSTSGTFVATGTTFGTMFTAHGATVLQTSLPGYG